MSWASFKTDFFNSYTQGQHVLAVGQNGWGKTHLELDLLAEAARLGAWEAFFWTKPKDRELEDYLARHPGKVVKGQDHNWKRPPPLVYVKPEAKSLRALKVSQTAIFSAALDGIWQAGRWIVYLDEIRYLGQLLGLNTELQILYTQARSSDVGLWAGTQRPRWIVVEALTEVKHFFLGAVSDKMDQKRLAEVLGWDLVRKAANLPPHTFLYVGPDFSAIVRVPR